MRYYEALFIAHPSLEDTGLSKVIGAAKKFVTGRGGELLYEEIMGKKRLAYAVEKQRFGTYVLLQFQGDKIDHARLNRDLELNDNVLAHLVVSIEHDEVREAAVPEPAAEAKAVEAPAEASTAPEGKAEKAEKAGEADPAEPDSVDPEPAEAPAPEASAEEAEAGQATESAEPEAAAEKEVEAESDG